MRQSIVASPCLRMYPAILGVVSLGRLLTLPSFLLIRRACSGKSASACRFALEWLIAPLLAFPERASASIVSCDISLALGLSHLSCLVPVRFVRELLGISGD